MSRQASDAARVAAVAGGLGLAAGHNAAVHRVLPGRMHLPANLALALAELALARGRGAGLADLGLAPGRLPGGVALGTRVGLVAAGAVALAAAVPATAGLFYDERVAGHDRAAARYEALLRIPIATALAEELVFRAALPALISGGPPALVSDLVSAAWFGAWHVLPTVDALGTNRVAARAQRLGHRLAAVGGVVAATTLAGLGFAWLRRRSASIAAPVLVHTAVNLSAYGFSRLRARRSEATPVP
ncbi:MAG: CPBP family intramembrane metalloprotease [Actinobacteria bacterium]|nr:CPBP family intramembrane metalloprotease [Actinomycetota bacterium]